MCRLAERRWLDGSRARDRLCGRRRIHRRCDRTLLYRIGANSSGKPKGIRNSGSRSETSTRGTLETLSHRTGSTTQSSPLPANTAQGARGIGAGRSVAKASDSHTALSASRINAASLRAGGCRRTSGPSNASTCFTRRSPSRNRRCNHHGPLLRRRRARVASNKSSSDTRFDADRVYNNCP